MFNSNNTYFDRKKNYRNHYQVKLQLVITHCNIKLVSKSIPFMDKFKVMIWLHMVRHSWINWLFCNLFSVDNFVNMTSVCWNYLQCNYCQCCRNVVLAANWNKFKLKYKINKTKTQLNTNKTTDKMTKAQHY